MKKKIDIPPILAAGGRDLDAIRFRIETLEKLLERSFRIPVVNIPCGLDALIGLVPVIGDLISTSMGAYLVWEARNLKLSRFQMMRMSANVAFDAALGAIPVAGDAIDLFWRSNSRNLRIIKRHCEQCILHT